MQQSPKLADIRSFVAVASAGSFVAASKQMGRDPTVLSRSVQAIERLLGVRLADRTTRVFSLTEAGRAYYAQTAAVLQALDAANRQVCAFSEGEPHGHLKVALPGSFARMWLAPAITAFLIAYPKVTLDAHYSNDLVDLVGQGFDAAVRLAELADSGLVARKVANRRRLVCASPDYLKTRGLPVCPEQLSEHACLCFTGRSDPYRWQFRSSAGAERSLVVKGRISSDDADLLVESAIDGLGILYTTDWHVGPHLSAGRLVEVLPDWLVPDGGGIYLLTGSAKHLPSKTRAFSDWIARELAKAPWSAPA